MSEMGDNRREMREALKAQLGNPVVSKSQQRLLVAIVKLAGGFKSAGWVLLIFVGLVIVGHYTGFEQWVRIFMGIEGNE